MRDPTAHQVQYRSVRREVLPIKLGDGGDGAIVYMSDEPGETVELLVRGLVVAPESSWGQLRHF